VLVVLRRSRSVVRCMFVGAFVDFLDTNSALPFATADVNYACELGYPDWHILFNSPQVAQCLAQLYDLEILHVETGSCVLALIYGFLRTRAYKSLTCNTSTHPRSKPAPPILVESIGKERLPWSFPEAQTVCSMLKPSHVRQCISKLHRSRHTTNSSQT